MTAVGTRGAECACALALVCEPPHRRATPSLSLPLSLSGSAAPGDMANSCTVLCLRSARFRVGSGPGPSRELPPRWLRRDPLRREGGGIRCRPFRLDSDSEPLALPARRDDRVAVGGNQRLLPAEVTSIILAQVTPPRGRCFQQSSDDGVCIASGGCSHVLLGHADEPTRLCAYCGSCPGRSCSCPRRS